MGRKKFYAVLRGRNPGIYTDWFGKSGAQVQVTGYTGARYKGFATIEEAREFIASNGRIETGGNRRKRPLNALSKPCAPGPVREEENDRIQVFTDGGAIGNPGPGGYGAVIIDGEKRRELQGGFRMTTNNRMELTAVIKALESIPDAKKVKVTTDSRYVVDGISKGWARRWREKKWMRSSGQPALNADLWGRLLALCEGRDVAFRWIKGHAGHPENERCDVLANTAARMESRQEDLGYTAGKMPDV